MNVQRNIETRSRNHRYSGKTIRIIHSVCMFVAFCMQHGMRMRHIVMRDLSGSTIFVHIIS